MSMTEHAEVAGGDRRLENRVRELETKVHTLELSDAQHRTEIAGLKGEISGLRSSSATSFEVKAAADLQTMALSHLRQDVAGIKTILYWFIGLIVAGFVVAVGNSVYR